MSKLVSALESAKFTDGLAVVEEAGLQGMITLRGDLGDKKLVKAVKSVAGSMPAQRCVVGKGTGSAAWMSPDEVLLMVPYGDVAQVIERLNKALAGSHALSVDVSDARAVFDVKGARAREVLSKLAPVDFAAGAFEEGTIRRSRMAQIPAAFWMTGPDIIRVVCFRSVAQYAFDVLCVAAQAGSEVDAL